MLIVDDRRRWVTANDAACALLGASRDEIPWRTMEHFTPLSGRSRLDEQWQGFLASGAAEGWYPLDTPDHGTVPVEFSAVANVLEGRHLTVFIPPDGASIAEGRTAAARDAVWAPVVTEGLKPGRLTKREREVMTLIAAGGHSEDIATHLFLSPETVKSHVHNAMNKLGAHTRAHAVAIALATGQIIWSMYDGTSEDQTTPSA